MVNEIFKNLSEVAEAIINEYKKQYKKEYKKLYQRQYRAKKKFDLALEKYALIRAEFEDFKENYKRKFK